MRPLRWGLVHLSPCCFISDSVTIPSCWDGLLTFLERVCVCACPCVHTVDLAGVCVFATQSCPTLCDLTDSSLQAPLSVE